MALTEKSRSALYQGLTTIADEQAVQEMLSYFPARDVEEPVTKELLRAEMSDLRTELRGEMSELRGEMSAMEIRLTDKISRALIWSIGANIAAMVAIAAVIVAAVRI